MSNVGFLITFFIVILLVIIFALIAVVGAVSGAVAGIVDEEEEAEKAANKGEAEIIIAKHRNGSVGTVKLLFQGSITKFKNPIKTDVF